MAALVLALAASGRAQAQEVQGADIYFDPNNGIAIWQSPPFITVDPRASDEMWLWFDPSSRDLGLAFLDLAYPLNPLSQMQPPRCQFADPNFKQLVVCPPPPQLRGYKLVLGLGYPNDANVAPSVPKLPGPNEIEGGNKKDVVNGGQSDEEVDTGKGKDEVNPGDGRDTVDTGPQNDDANTRDGEVDRLNGGAGNRDEATVDKKDKVKNVEVVKGK